MKRGEGFHFEFTSVKNASVGISPRNQTKGIIVANCHNHIRLHRYALRSLYLLLVATNATTDTTRTDITTIITTRGRDLECLLESDG